MSDSQPATSIPPTIDVSIDTSGLKCPLPILRAKKALASMTTGQVLEVISTDPNAVGDFQAFCRQTDNTLLHQEIAAPTFIHYLRRR